MRRWPPALPERPPAIRNAAAPGCLIECDAPADRDGIKRVDIDLAEGRIAAIRPAAESGEGVDLDGAMVWPCFVDMHTHLDKGHIWPRAENPDGTFAGALAATAADRSVRWTDEDVERRMEFGLRAAYAHGTRAVRTHLDSIAPQHAVSWPVFARLRERWRGRIELQAVSILLLEQLDGDFGVELADTIARHGGLLGTVVLPQPDTAARLDRLFGLAAERGLELDFHADESGDTAAQALDAIADAKLRRRFAGRVAVGHCCSLAVQPDDVVERTIRRTADAGVAVVSLPMCNLYLQDRAPGRTPRWRGVTLLHELRAGGVAVALASDNCRDPFYGYGDHDMLEVFREAARIAHLDRPVGEWPAAVAATPAEIVGLPDGGSIRVGAPADLVLFDARDYSELLSRPQSDRIVLRRGRAIDARPPSYRELDESIREKVLP